MRPLPTPHESVGSAAEVPIPSVAVVICAYTEERWDDLQAATGSALTQQPPPDEVIVVIDHNRTLYEQAASTFTGVTVVPNAAGKGLSGARNTGVAAASADLVAFLDDDATARPGWLAALCAPLTDRAVLGTGGAVLPAWGGAVPGWLPPAFWWVVGCSYEGMPTTTAPIRNPIGASMLFRRSHLVEIGGFSEGLGRVGRNAYGCEETELCIRATQRWPGHRHVYVPGAVVDHRVPPARSQWRYFVRRCYSEGLSKAHVSSLVGGDDGLSSERSYALQVLPRTVLRSGRQAARTRSLRPFGACAAVAAGVAAVGAGLTVGSLRVRTPRRVQIQPTVTPGFVPTCVLDYRVGRPFPTIPEADPAGTPYRRALVLVRDGSRPLGLVELDLPTDPDPELLAAAVDRQARLAS
jgi:GT2 family glycosyltransferase